MKKNLIIGLVIVLLVATGIFFFVKQWGISMWWNDYTGKKVMVDYIWSYTDGKVFDTSIEEVAKKNALYNPQRAYAPLEFVVGSNDVIPWFRKAVNGMRIWDTKKVTIEPKDAYWEYDDTKVSKVPRSVFQDANIIPEVGWTYNMWWYPAIAKEVSETEVTLDLNPPMAWKTLIFEITLKSVEN